MNLQVPVTQERWKLWASSHVPEDANMSPRILQLQGGVKRKDVTSKCDQCKCCPGETRQRGVLQKHIPDISPRMDCTDCPTVYHLVTKSKEFTSKHARTVLYSLHPSSTDFHPSPNSDLGLVTWLSGSRHLPPGLTILGTHIVEKENKILQVFLRAPQACYGMDVCAHTWPRDRDRDRQERETEKGSY